MDENKGNFVVPTESEQLAMWGIVALNVPSPHFISCPRPLSLSPYTVPLNME